MRRVPARVKSRSRRRQVRKNLRVLSDDALGHLEVLVVYALGFLLAPDEVEAALDSLLLYHVFEQLLLLLVTPVWMLNLDGQVL